MFLVAVALGFSVPGSYIGPRTRACAARICGFAGLGMLLVAAFAGECFPVRGVRGRWPATGIFVSIINIFVSLLNLFSD